MTAQHTPGPWRMSADSDETMNPAFLITESNTTDWPSIVAEVNGEANARLIAAAPDLLEALKSVQAAIYIDDAGQLRLTRSFDESVLDAAIARATHKEQKCSAG